MGVVKRDTRSLDNSPYEHSTDHCKDCSVKGNPCAIIDVKLLSSLPCTIAPPKPLLSSSCDCHCRSFRDGASLLASLVLLALQGKWGSGFLE